MKISYSPITGSGYVTLLDTGDGSGILKAFKPSHVVQEQTEQLAQNPTEFRQPRGNIRCTLTLAWNIQYASIPLALQAILNTKDALINLALNLKVQESTEVQTYANGLFTQIDGDLVGVSVDYTATFISDAGKH